MTTYKEHVRSMSFRKLMDEVESHRQPLRRKSVPMFDIRYFTSTGPISASSLSSSSSTSSANPSSPLSSTSSNENILSKKSGRPSSSGRRSGSALSRSKELSSENRTLRKRVVDLEKELESAKKEMAEVEKQAAHLKRERNRLADSERSMKERMWKKSREQKGKSQRFDEAEANSERDEEKNRSNAFDDFQGRTNSSESVGLLMLEEARAKIAEMKTELDQMRREKEDGNHVIRELKDSIEREKAARADAEKAAKEASQAVREREAMIRKLEDELVSAKTMSLKVSRNYSPLPELDSNGHAVTPIPKSNRVSRLKHRSHTENALYAPLRVEEQRGGANAHQSGNNSNNDGDGICGFGSGSSGTSASDRAEKGRMSSEKKSKSSGALVMGSQRMRRDTGTSYLPSNHRPGQCHHFRSCLLVGQSLSSDRAVAIGEQFDRYYSEDDIQRPSAVVDRSTGDSHSHERERRLLEEENSKLSSEVQTLSANLEKCKMQIARFKEVVHDLTERFARVSTGESGKAWEIKSSELKLVELIGIGNFGQVWKGEWRGSTVAVKRVDFGTAEGAFGSQQIEQFRQEAAIMKYVVPLFIFRVTARCIRLSSCVAIRLLAWLSSSPPHFVSL
jgi:predicted  nucleic acid-binding Zn-ribbon protein